jgi:hypothetical protein
MGRAITIAIMTAHIKLSFKKINLSNLKNKETQKENIQRATSIEITIICFI